MSARGIPVRPPCGEAQQRPPHVVHGLVGDATLSLPPRSAHGRRQTRGHLDRLAGRVPPRHLPPHQGAGVPISQCESHASSATMPAALAIITDPIQRPLRIGRA